MLEALAVGIIRWRGSASDGAPRPSVRTHALRVAAFTLIAVVVLPGALFALRAYQVPSVRARLEADYLRAPREPLAIEAQPDPSGRVLLTMPVLVTTRVAESWLASAYLVVELSSRACEATRVPLTFRYATADPVGNDFSRDYLVDLDAGGEPTIIFFPVFNDEVFAKFTGIVLGAAHRACVASVSRIEPAREPSLLLFAVLPPDWRASALYSTLTAFEQTDQERRNASAAGPP